MNRRRLFQSSVLLVAIVGFGVALAVWKQASIQRAEAAATSQPEPTEAVTVAVAQEREHGSATTSIGTVVALRSITLRNELPGTVRRVLLTPGRVVDEGTVLVALDVSVEEAELKALQAQAALAQTQLDRMQRLSQRRAASEADFDAALAERDVALAQIARTRAIIARKTIRAPFRAHVGISDVHPGQYLNEGTLLTTLQGVDESAYVDFTVAQQVASALRQGDRVEVFGGDNATTAKAEILAIDARVDPTTRNATVRARIDNAGDGPTPGASVRVRIPVGSPRKVVAIPASALRKGPAGEHVFVLEQDDAGATRAHARTVQAGALLGDEVMIERGLSAGEQVAASGSFKLRDAVQVAVANPPATAGNGPGR